MTPEEALSFVIDQGVVLEAARGPVPNLAEAIVGEPIGGSWWGHPLSHTIYALTHAVRDDTDVLVCRLVKGKVTYIHRRLWPALARLAPELDSRRTAAIEEEHLPSGTHRVIETPIDAWLPTEVRESAQDLTREQAIDDLGPWIAPLLGVREQPHRNRSTHRWL